MKEPLITSQKKGLKYFFLPAWEKTGLVKHGFSARKNNNERPDVDREERARFLKIWAKNEEELFSGEQVHGTAVCTVDRAAFRRRKREFPGVDALVTAERGAVLGAFSADCLLALFWDAAVPAVGIAHAGWRGSCMGILSRVIEVFRYSFNTKPQDLQVLMGPSIGPCCYEVGDEVLHLCSGSPWKKEIVFYPGFREGHSFLDLRKTNSNILSGAGVNRENIHVSYYCTRCNQHLFYSYRGAGGRHTGSLMGIIFLP